MEFMPMRTLSRDTQTLLNNLQRDGELVVTNNGQPTILMIDLTGRDLIETVSNFRKSQISIPSPQKQHEALKQFFEAVDTVDDEPLNDDDFIALENSRISFNRELDL